MQDDRDVLGEQAVASGALVEIEWNAAPQNRDARHLDIHEGRIELDTGAARSGKDTAPVGIAASEGGLDERRGGNGFGDFLGGGFGFCATNFDFDDALSAFPVSDDLQS